MESRSPNETPDLRSQAVSSSPQISSAPADYELPLTQLHSVLMDFIKAANDFHDSLSDVRKLANPWFWEKAHPEQEALRILLGAINHDVLSDGLNDSIKAIKDFSKNYLQALIMFFAEADKQQSAVAQELVDSASQKVHNDFDAACKSYKALLDKLLDYDRKVHEFQLSSDWIENDLRKIQKWNQDASEYAESLSNLQDKINQALRQDRLKELSDVERRLDEETDISAPLSLQRDVDASLLAADSLMSAKFDKNVIDARKQKMEALRHIFVEDTEYERLSQSTSDDLSPKVNKLNAELNAYLKGFKSQQLDQAKILGLLQQLLNPLAKQNDIEQTIVHLLDGGRDTAQCRQVLIGYKRQVEDQQNALNLDKSILEKLDLKNIENIKQVLGIADEDNALQGLFLPTLGRMRLDVVQPNTRKSALSRLKLLVLNAGAVETSKKALADYSSALKADELKLRSFADRLNEADKHDRQTLTTDLKFLLADKEACQFSNCEAFLKKCLEKLDEEMAHVKAASESFLRTQAEIDKHLVKYNAVMKFKDADHAIAGTAAKCKQLEQEKIGGHIIGDLAAIRDKWQAVAQDKSIYSNHVFSASLPVTKDDFNKVLFRILQQLYKFPIAHPKRLEVPTAAGEVYQAAVNKYNVLRQARREVRRLIGKLEPTMLLPEFNGGQSELFDRVVGYIFKQLSSDDNESAFGRQVKANAQRFSAYCDRVEWSERFIPANERLQKLIAIPSELRAMLDMLNAQGDHLSDSIIVENLDEKKALLGNALQELAKHKLALDTFVHNIQVFLRRNKRYNELSRQRALVLSSINEKLKALTIKIADIDQLKKVDETSLVLIDQTMKAIEEVSKRRYQAYDHIANAGATMTQRATEVDGALVEIEAEAKFKANVALLYKDITALKQAENAICVERGELFQNIKREFLFAGKSRDIIAQLEAHKQKNHAHTAKGRKITSFIQGLGANGIQDLQALRRYLERPFDDEDSNHTLFATKNVFGRASTTEQLVVELRKELEGLVARESVGAEGSIMHVIKQDYACIKDEYSAIIASKDKDFEKRPASLAMVSSCKAFAEEALAIPVSAPGAIKLHQDIIEIRRGSGIGNINLASRQARMECAIAIRQNKRREMDALSKKYPFSYSHQALKYHLEAVTTNRTERLRDMWECLDDIASMPGSEASKYAQMRVGMLDYFNALRVEDSHSFTGFFGRVSRLTRGMEQFLLMSADGGGLGFANGEGEDEVHHVEETRLYALSCFKSQP